MVHGVQHRKSVPSGAMLRGATPVGRGAGGGARDSWPYGRLRQTLISMELYLLGAGHMDEIADED